MPAVGLLYPRPARSPRPPEALALGRAALRLAAEGIVVVLGDRVEDGALCGDRAIPGGWVSCRTQVVGAVDRFPGFGRPQAHQALLAGLGDVQIANPPRLNALLRDKLACQTALEGLRMPDLCVDPRRFDASLRAWGAGFLKPRFGSFGAGVRFVRPGDALPARMCVDGVDQPTVLQRAVPPPDGLGGVSVRVLVQRDVDGGWVVSPGAARVHPTDPVVNHARGADVAPCADRFGSDVDAACGARALDVARRLPSAVELGVDLVLDPAGVPHVIEVNGQPRGRLAELAASDPDRFGGLHLDALCRPFRVVAAGRVRSG